MYSEGKSMSEIARIMGRNKSSVSREIARNKNKDGKYQPWRATILYICRRKKCVRRNRLEGGEIRDFVEECLDKAWPPEAIAARWNREHEEDTMSHSTIYRALQKRLLSSRFTAKTHLRRRDKRKHNHNTQVIYPVHTIHERPDEAVARERLGDMEGDTMYGAIGKGCVVTAVDRRSRMLYASLCDSRDSSLIVEAFGRAFNGVKVNSLTLDRGSEFARFAELEQNHKTTVYFADPHSPWQRGTNENTNGILRFFFPKGTNFKEVSEDYFRQVVALINDRPRKCLGWLSPLEFISAMCCT
jgi:IS30 family transposase